MAYSLQTGANRQRGPSQRTDGQLVARAPVPASNARGQAAGTTGSVAPASRLQGYARIRRLARFTQPDSPTRCSRIGHAEHPPRRRARQSSPSSAHQEARERRAGDPVARNGASRARDQLAQPALHPVTCDRRSRRGGRQRSRASGGPAGTTPGRARITAAAPHSAPGLRDQPVVACGYARGLRPAARASGGKLVAALAPTSGQDGAPGTGAHAQAETVRLGPPAIVGLERALAQGQLRCGSVALRADSGPTTQPRRDRAPTRATPLTVEARGRGACQVSRNGSHRA